MHIFFVLRELIFFSGEISKRVDSQDRMHHGTNQNDISDNLNIMYFYNYHYNTHDFINLPCPFLDDVWIRRFEQFAMPFRLMETFFVRIVVLQRSMLGPLRFGLRCPGK